MSIGFRISEEISSPCPEFGCADGAGRTLACYNEQVLYECEECGKEVLCPLELIGTKGASVQAQYMYQQRRLRYGYFVDARTSTGQSFQRHRLCSWTCQRKFEKRLQLIQEEKDRQFWENERKAELLKEQERELKKIKNMWKRSKAQKEK